MTNTDDFEKALDIFQANGYTELDTARYYQEGEQERFTGQSDWMKNGFSIGPKASKLGNSRSQFVA